MIVTRGLGRDTDVPMPPAGLRIDDIYHASMTTRGYGGVSSTVIQPPSIHEFVEGWGGVPIFVGISKVRKKVS